MVNTNRQTYKAERGHHKVFLFAINLESSYVSKEYSFTEDYILQPVWTYICLYYAHFHWRNGVVRSWEPSAMNGLAARLKKNIFWSNSYLWVITPKFGWLIERRVRHFKQHLLSPCWQHFPLLLSLVLNWSIESDLPYLATFGHSIKLRTHLLYGLTRYVILKLAQTGFV